MDSIQSQSPELSSRRDQARRIRSVGGKPAPKGVRVHGLWAGRWKRIVHVHVLYATASLVEGLSGAVRTIRYGLSGRQALYVQYAMLRSHDQHPNDQNKTIGYGARVRAHITGRKMAWS